MEKTLKFEYSKETKNTFVYSEIAPEDEEVSVPTLYIKKSAFEEERPDEIIVTIKSVEK